MIAVRPASLVIAPAVALAGCGIVTQDQINNRELGRYARVMTIAQMDFAPGGLSRADVADDAQIMFAPYSRVPGKPVSCRSDVVIDTAGVVSKACTVCTDDKATAALEASDGYARTLHFKAGAEGRRGTMTFAYAPQRPDGSLLVPRIPAPGAACEPKPVSP